MAKTRTNTSNKSEKKKPKRSDTNGDDVFVVCNYCRALKRKNHKCNWCNNKTWME